METRETSFWRGQGKLSSRSVKLHSQILGSRGGFGEIQQQLDAANVVVDARAMKTESELIPLPFLALVAVVAAGNEWMSNHACVAVLEAGFWRCPNTSGIVQGVA
jgi:hypothetical protein